jgi:hypothetical protein
MVFEYVDRYKHHPQTVPGLSWHEFASLVVRTGRSEVRDRLIMADAFIIGQPAESPADATLRKMQKAGLERVAWPGREG